MRQSAFGTPDGSRYHPLNWRSRLDVTEGAKFLERRARVAEQRELVRIHRVGPSIVIAFSEHVQMWACEPYAVWIGVRRSVHIEPRQNHDDLHSVLEPQFREPNCAPPNV